MFATCCGLQSVRTLTVDAFVSDVFMYGKVRRLEFVHLLFCPLNVSKTKITRPDGWSMAKGTTLRGRGELIPAAMGERKSATPSVTLDHPGHS
jgi:hypothetical protein